MSEETIKVERDGAIVRIRMNRPDKRNAQNPTLINEMDAAFMAAGADPDVRVIVLSGEGPSFSGGHDLEYPGYDRRRYTYQTRLDMERDLFVDKMLRIRNLPKPTIAQVQGHCVAAGLMLACMCDLIVAADDAVFSNPVLRMTGAGVELLVEPWELGLRKAKEFLWTGDAVDAREAWRLGLVNRVVPRKRLADETLALAERIALVPPVTASLVKESLNQTAALMGKEHAWRYHFMVHQFMHGTKTAADALRARRKTGSMKRMLVDRDRAFAKRRVS